jgi:protein-S-isoprenylcysteine O-methyltransferase Ste14
VTLDIAVICLWAGWLASWMLAGAWSKDTVARPDRGAERLYAILANLGFALLFVSVYHFKPTPRLWTAPPAARWSLAGVAAAGLAFCWWARLHLGPNWSWEVTRKHAHEIVDTGPYRLVRHPIYTGLILSAAATGALFARAPSIVAVALIVAGLAIKARLEERFLSAELGEAAYGGYRRRTGMLLPRL